MTSTLRRITALLALLFVSTPVPAQAQLSGLGGLLTLTGSSGLIYGNDTAYDPVNDVYLVVSAFGPVWGTFVNGSGVQLAPSFVIKNGGPWPTAHWPRVIYSPHLTNGSSGSGGFLVTWHQDQAAQGTNGVFARAVAYGVGATGPEIVVSSAPTNWNIAAAVAYSESSRRFLVTWTSLTWATEGRFIDVAAGTGIPSAAGGPFTIADPAGGGTRNPGVAWDSASNQFGVSYAAWGGAGAFVGFVRVRPSDGLLSGRTTFGHSLGTYLTDLVFNSATNNFVMAWSNTSGSNRAELAGSSALLGEGLISPTLGGVSSLGLTFNPVSGTLLATGQNMLYCDIVVSELNSSGTPYGTATAINSCNPHGGDGSYFPRATARPNARHFAVSFIMNNTIHRFQRLSTASTGSGGTSGGGGGGGTPPPPAPLVVNSLTPSQAFPAFQGATVTWTAQASGGTSPQFQFWQYTEGSGWGVAQTYSANNTFTWTPPAGKHAVQVWARSSGSGAAYDAYAGTGVFEVVPATPRLTAVSTTPSNPAPSNTPVTWTAQSVGGGQPVQYQFWRYTPATGWQIGQPYSTSNTFTWTPPVGTNYVQVWVRSAGSGAAYQDWWSGAIQVVAAPARIVRLTPNFLFHTAPGVPVTWTATGAGGSGPLEYKFFAFSYNTGVWTVLRDWSPFGHVTWAPPGGTAGHHVVQAWVRTVGSGATYEDWAATTPFVITDSTSLALTANRSLSGLRQGDVVQWVATVGGPGSWEYRFFTFNGSTWTEHGSPGGLNAFTWTMTAGVRAVQVWIRRPGTASPWERWTGSATFVVSP